MNKQKKHRTFIAIELPEKVKEEITFLQNKEVRWIRWMDPENMHITLNFLGDLTEDQITTVQNICEMIIRDYSGFDLVLNKIKILRDMIWILPEDKKEIFQLHDDLNSELRKVKIGKRERRRYAPHILIGRSKRESRKMTYEPKLDENLTFPVKSINIYTSELKPDSAVHTLVAKIPFYED